MRKLLVLALFAGQLWASPLVKMNTSAGEIVIELDEVKAPNTVANFLKYVKSGFYNGTIFHRVIPGFVIQGGGFDGNLQKKHTEDPIANEAHNGLKNSQYTLSMARTPDPHSATSQFFINLVDNPALDPQGASPHGYAVFGKVVKGQNVVEKIGKVPTESKNGMDDVPSQNVEIIDVQLVEEPAKEKK